jgi:hypothetical protein
MPFRFVRKLVKNETRDGVVAVGEYRRLHPNAFAKRAFDGEAAAINYRCDILDDNSRSPF